MLKYDQNPGYELCFEFVDGDGQQRKKLLVVVGWSVV